MVKIWIVDSRYHKRTFRTEKAFLDFIASARKNKYKVNYKIQIYELIEEHSDSDVYFDSFLTQKERDEQLSVLLDNNIQIQTLQKINTMLEDFLATVEKSNRSFRKYLDSISISTLTYDSFKKIITDQDIRRSLLYFGPDSVEWYKTLLTVHNFKFETELKVRRNGVIQIPQNRIDNYRKAKQELKTKK